MDDLAALCIHNNKLALLYAIRLLRYSSFIPPINNIHPCLTAAFEGQVYLHLQMILGDRGSPLAAPV
jgi:hypothetical protein